MFGPHHHEPHELLTQNLLYLICLHTHTHSNNGPCPSRTFPSRVLLECVKILQLQPQGVAPSFMEATPIYGYVIN